jgi:cystathionine beta-synthase
MKNSILKAIGNTPLVKIDLDCKATVYAKLEYLNPGGSVKDRSALYLIEQAEKSGQLKPGGTIIDASSGNQGIAVAMIGAAKGYKVIITTTEKISQEKKQTMEAYGAEVVLCPYTEFIEDPKNYHQQALRLHQATENSFMPNQYFNLDNAKAHETLLAPEIWEQTNGKVTHFFAGAGTGGTVSGVGKYLKKKNPDVKIFAIDSINSLRATNGNPKPYKLEGLGIDFNTPVLDKNVINDFLEVKDSDAIAILKRLAKQHGLLVGPSSGGVAAMAEQYLKNLNEDAVAVMIFGDSGRAYLTKEFYNSESLSNKKCKTKINQTTLQT